MRKLCCGLLCALTVFTGCGCGSTQPTVLSDQDLKELRELDTPYIGIVLKSLDGQFYPLIKAGAEAEAAALNAELIVVAPESENESEEQAELLRLMASMALDVIAISPCDERLLDEGLELAHSNGKHILAIDEPLKYEFCEGYIGIYDREAGKRQAMYAANTAVSDTAVILRGSEDSSNHIDRVSSIKQQLYQSGITVVSSVNCSSSRSEAFSATVKLLSQYPDLGVICATNDDMAIGAQQAVQSLGKNVPIVSIDGTPEAVRLVMEGKIAGVVDQDAYEIGKRAVDNAVKLHFGEKIKDEYVPVRVITKQTAQDCMDILNRRLELY